MIANRFSSKGRFLNKFCLPAKEFPLLAGTSTCVTAFRLAFKVNAKRLKRIIRELKKRRLGAVPAQLVSRIEKRNRSSKLDAKVLQEIGEANGIFFHVDQLSMLELPCTLLARKVCMWPYLLSARELVVCQCVCLSACE
jgi:hypothetical protein